MPKTGCLYLVLFWLTAMCLWPACGEGYPPLRAPQKTDCTIGLAMGNATPDGRPICWKNRDWSDGNNRLFYDDSGTYAFIGIGATATLMGLNQTGLSVGNSVVWNLDDGGDNIAAMDWALKNAATLDEVRGAIIEETEGSASHWDGRGASGCFPFMDSRGQASMFEIGVYSYYEYDPTNPDRLAQYPTQVVARANEAHKNDDHTDDAYTGGERYTEARDMMIERAQVGGITIGEMLQVSRRGEPGGYHLISNYMTLAAQLNHGVLEGEDPRIATMWASVGQPDYCIFVPVWVAAGDSLSGRLTSRSDTDGLAGRSWEIYDGKDNADYDDYVNALYAGFQANLLEAGALVREHWFQDGFDVAQADALSDEAAETAWHIMNSLALGSGRDLNQPPELTALDIQPVGGGFTFSFSRTAADPDGSLTGTDWDFGDGTGDVGDAVTHEYGQAGSFLVRCRVEDDQGARNSRWAFLEVPVGPVCGDGTVDPGEACDPGEPAGQHCCDPLTCQWIPAGVTDPQSVCAGAPACQRDVCDGAGSCTRVEVAEGTPCASDGLFCNGPEQCQGGVCGSPGSPCPGTDCNRCNEEDDSCFDPQGTPCFSDGLFCTGAEVCDGAGSCVSAGDPCPGTECKRCNEAADGCFDPAGTLCASDGLFCTGPEQCDGLGNCLSGGDPCVAPSTCDEQQDLCLGCESDGDCPLCQWCDAGVCQNQPAGSDQKNECPDENRCNGQESCDGQGACRAGQPLECDDGVYCNGPEDCHPVHGCLAGRPPCDDGDACTRDVCLEESASCRHDPDPACADGGTGGDDGTGTDGGQQPNITGGCSCRAGEGASFRYPGLALLLAGVWLSTRPGRRRRGVPDPGRNPPA